MITATIRHDFLNIFVQLGGFPLLNEIESKSTEFNTLRQELHEKIEEICDREARIDVLRQNNVTKKLIINIKKKLNHERER